MSERKLFGPETSQQPEMWMGTTHECFLGCRYCYTQNPKVQRALKKDLALDEVQAAVDAGLGVRPERLTAPQILGVVENYTQLGGRKLILSGGEPLTRPDIGNIISGVADQPVSVMLGTNGALITEDLAGLIVDTGIDELQVKADGPQFIQDWLSGSGFYEAMVEGIGRVVELRRGNRKPYFFGNCVLSKATLPFAEEVITNALRLGLDSVHFQLLFPGNPTFYDWARLDSGDIPALDRLIEIAEKYRPEIDLDEENYLLAIRMMLEIGERPYEGCNAGKNFFYVDPMGRAFICPYSWVSGGNVATTPLAEIKFPDFDPGHMEPCPTCLSTADNWHSEEFLPEGIRS